MLATHPFSVLPEGSVLVASRAEVWRDQVIRELSGQEHVVGLASGGADALQKLESGRWKTLLLESALPDLDPLEVAQLARQRHPGLEVRLLEPYPTGSPQLVSATPPPDISSASFSRIWQAATKNPDRGPRPGCEPLPGMVGTSKPMQRVYDLARRVVVRATTVLITGATGTGKEILARAVHQLSARAARAFVVVNCAAIPETLIESELFGYTRGAFTGAVQSQAGRISAAHGGTLFLDEVGELPLSMQAKLLRFIELKEIQRLGSPEISRVDARIIAATNSDLARRVAEKQFREDLFYRLAVFCIPMPTLEERIDDIVPLARHFLAAVARSAGTEPPALSQAVIHLLMRHSWPGNVRELQFVIERACILAEGEREILPEHISFPGLPRPLEREREMHGIAV